MHSKFKTISLLNLFAVLLFAESNAQQPIFIDDLLVPLSNYAIYDQVGGIAQTNGQTFIHQSTFGSSDIDYAIYRSLIIRYNADFKPIDTLDIFNGGNELNYTVALFANADTLEAFIGKHTPGNYLNEWGIKRWDISNGWKLIDSNSFQFGEKVIDILRPKKNRKGNYVFYYYQSDSPTSLVNYTARFAEITPTGDIVYEIPPLGDLLSAQVSDTTYAAYRSGNDKKLVIYDSSYQVIKQIPITPSNEGDIALQSTVTLGDADEVFFGFRNQIFLSSLKKRDKLVRLKNQTAQTFCLIPLDLPENYNASTNDPSITDDGENIFFGNTYVYPGFDSLIKTYITVHKVNKNGQVVWSKYLASKQRIFARRFSVLPNGQLLILLQTSIQSLIQPQIVERDFFSLILNPDDGQIVAAPEPFSPAFSRRFEVWPNPAEGRFFAQPPTEKGIFELFDEQGKSLFSIKSEGQKPVELHAEKGASGTFWLHFFDEKSRREWAEKIVKINPGF